MKRRFLPAVFILLLFCYQTYGWVQITAVPSQDISALAAYHDTLFAASDTNEIYKSIDGGITWSTIVVSVNPVNILVLRVIDDTLYAGTLNSGIFRSADNGNTWQQSGTGLLPVSSIEKQGTQIYASTIGSGVYQFNRGTGNWNARNDSLPSYSFNVGSLIGTTTSLIIAAGANGTFYRYNFSSNSWVEEYYYGSLAPGLQIDKLIHQSDTIFAVNGNRIIRSEDDGLTWTDDKTGTHNGYTRNIYPGLAKHYTLTNVISAGTWIQQRDLNASTLTTWALNEEFVAGGYSYDILEFQNKLFLAREDGLYVKNITTGIEPVRNADPNVKIKMDYAAGSISFSSDRVVKSIQITDRSGKVVYSAYPGKNEFTLHLQPATGFYLVSLHFTDGSNTVTKIIL